MHELILAHIYYSLTSLSVNNPPPMYLLFQLQQPVTFCWTDGGRSSERKANETGYPYLWLFHRRRTRKITHALTLNESIKSQSVLKTTACLPSLLIQCQAPFFCPVLPRNRSPSVIQALRHNTKSSSEVSSAYKLSEIT